MLNTIISIVLTIIVLPLLYFAYTTLTKPRNFPPGPIGIPFLGSYHLLFPVHINHAKLARIYGNIFTLKMSSTNVVCISGYNLIKEVMIDRAKEFSSRRLTNLTKLVRGPGREGIISAPYGPKWAAHRKLFHSSFRNIEQNNRSVEKCTTDELVAVIGELDMLATEDKPVDPAYILHYATLNVLAAFVFGYRCTYNDSKFKKLLSLNEEFFKTITMARSFLFYIVLQIPHLYKIWLPKAGRNLINGVRKIKEFAHSEIQHHKETIDRESPKDLIDYYLLEMEKDDNEWFTEERLAYTIADLFQAGTETTAVTLQWALLYMANNPSVQSKVQEEIDHVIGLERKPKYKDRLSMPYCEATVLEIQRKASIVPAGVDHAPSQDTTIRGYNISKNTSVKPALYMMHHSPEHWKNPDNFDPENFLDEDGNVEINDAFMPFGAGHTPIQPDISVLIKKFF